MLIDIHTHDSVYLNVYSLTISTLNILVLHVHVVSPIVVLSDGPGRNGHQARF